MAASGLVVLDTLTGVDVLDLKEEGLRCKLPDEVLIGIRSWRCCLETEI